MNTSVFPITEYDNFFIDVNITYSTISSLTDWGPKRDPLYIVIPISIIYVSIFITGVLGNVSTCIVISRNKCMHTATNYYLFSLAISDLLLLVAGLPPEIYYIWSKYPYIFGEEFCVLQGFAAEASANATVLTITAFTVERYVAICYPFFSHTLSKLNRAVKYIIYIWLFAMCLAVPQALVFGIVCEVLNGHLVEEHCVCVPKRSVIPYAFEISTAVFFVAPMTLITVLYLLIGVQLHKSIRPVRDNSLKLRDRNYKPVVNFSANNMVRAKILRDGDSRDETRKIYSKNSYAARNVIKMLVAVVVAFFICWAPFHAQRLLAIYGTPTSLPMRKAFQILTYVSGVFYYLSTTVNPLLYHIMSHKFREAFKATYRQCCKKRRSVPRGRCYSSLSARSSQVNSHSTDSYNQPAGRSTLRYLEQEMAHLRDNKRPMVVTFKRKRYPPTDNCTHYKHELREALEFLENDYLNSSNIRLDTSKPFAHHNSDIHVTLNSGQTSQVSCSGSEMEINYPYNVHFHRNLDLLQCNFTDCSRNNKFGSKEDSYKLETKKTDNLRTNFDRQAYLELKKKLSFMEVHNLQPTHVCPLNKNNFL